MRTATRALTTAAALVALALLGGCGASGGGATAAQGPPKLWVALMDCSASFRGFAHEYLDDFRALAQQAASAQVLLSYGCVAGRALNGAAPKTIDFSPGGALAQAGGNATMRRELGLARASGAAADMAKLLHGHNYGGSDQLAAIERASGNRQLARIVMWSDFIVHDGAFSLTPATSDAQIRRVAAQWIPRMGHGLRGVTVLAIGAGRGASGDEIARRAELLMRSVVQGAGGRIGTGDSFATASANVG